MNYQDRLLDFTENAILYHTRACGEAKNAFRKHSGLPYFVHITDVMKRVAHYGINFENSYKLGGEEVVFNYLAGAAGHDLKEDTHADMERLRALYGDPIPTIISECSRPEGDAATRQEKWNFLMSFLDKSVESVIIKIADRYCNVMDYMDRDPHYAAKYALQAYPLYVRWFRIVASNHFANCECVYDRVGEDLCQLLTIARTRYGEDFRIVDSDIALKEVCKLVV